MQFEDQGLPLWFSPKAMLLSRGALMSLRRSVETLLPIFYHMDPLDIRRHTETFAEAFASYEEQFQTDMEKVQRWKEALTEAANCFAASISKALQMGVMLQTLVLFHSFLFVVFFSFLLNVRK
jgi:hypothetical protein